MGERAMWPQGWVDDCKHWRGRLLTGKHGHWCQAWDGLPVDETCPEWPCECSDALESVAAEDIHHG